MRKSGERILFRYLRRKEHAEPGGKFRRKIIRPIPAQRNHGFPPTPGQQRQSSSAAEKNAESVATIEGSIVRYFRPNEPVESLTS